MDADGEDRPEELNNFFNKTKENPNMTITGNRFKRSEGIIFKILYEFHKILTFIFTGKLIYTLFSFENSCQIVLPILNE